MLLLKYCNSELSACGSQTNNTVHYSLVKFYVLLTVHLGTIFVNDQLDEQLFFMYVYFYSLRVSGSHVPNIRRINCINTTSGICHSVWMIVRCAGLDETGTTGVRWGYTPTSVYSHLSILPTQYTATSVYSHLSILPPQYTATSVYSHLSVLPPQYTPT
jgi:hypothetical protein